MISSARTRLASAAAVGALALTTVLAAAVPASAEVKRRADPRGDTWTYDTDGPVKVGGHPEADLRRVVVKHSARKVVVTARFANLKKLGDGGGLQVDLSTADDTTYGASASAGPGGWKGESSVYSGEEIDCGVDHSMGYRKDVVVLTMPTRCFDKPRWIKVRVFSFWSPSSEDFYFDDAYSKGYEGTLTRRIKRG